MQPTSNPTIQPTTQSTQSTTPSPTCPPAGDANTNNNNNNNNDDGIMSFMPWILLGVSGLFNMILFIALISQCKKVKALKRNSRVNDGTQMVAMMTRAGHSRMASNSDFQEITTDASVDYINMVE